MQTSKECAVWKLKWLPNEDLFWCCRNCVAEIVQHKYVHRVTVNNIYVSLFGMDIKYFIDTTKQMDFVFNVLTVIFT